MTENLLRRIYRIHYSMIQTLVINNSGTSDDARDIFQEAIIVLYEKAKSGSFELHAQLKTYIYAVCRRLWLKKLAHITSVFQEIWPMHRKRIATDDDLEMYEHRNRGF